MPNAVDLSGRIFGRLTAIKRSTSRGRRTFWRCSCACGAIVDVSTSNLRHSRSCGCLRREVAAARMRTHDNSTTPEYLAWRNMQVRCDDPKRPDYKNYGGRGVTVCQQWRNDFLSFLADVGRRPSAKHSIDRIKNDRPYEPGNVRWATRTEQNRNRRTTLKVTIDGKTLTIAEWAQIAGLSYCTMARRFQKMPADMAIAFPSREAR